MSNVLAVFGATGQQGSSVINHVLNDPELSQQYSIRAITRNVNSDKAKKLQETVQVVQADATDRASLKAALTHVHTVFAMTTPDFGPDALEVEFNVAKTIADVAVEKGVKYFIFSTLPAVRDMSGGKYTKVTAFDAKAKAEAYIRGLPIKSAFICPGSFMENFQSQPLWAPRRDSDGKWVISTNVSPKAQLPLIDAVGDTGKFVGAMLAEPGKYEGETVCASERLYSVEEIVATISKAAGQPVEYRQVSDEEFKEGLGFPSGISDIFMEGFRFYEEFKYYGPDAETLVARDAGNARGRLSTLDEFFEANPYRLLK
ncbi:hypothetical protein ACJ41O_000258 [Fusarium nematophilum]